MCADFNVALEVILLLRHQITRSIVTLQICVKSVQQHENLYVISCHPQESVRCHESLVVDVEDYYEDVPNVVMIEKYKRSKTHVFL